MTTNAQLAAQVANALTRWNAQLDQLADWLAGDPNGGPNLDGKYPLTNAEQETENFLCLPAILDLVDGPAGQVEIAKQTVAGLEELAASSRDDADTAKGLAEAARNATQILRDEVATLRDDVASKWSDVNVWSSQVSSEASAVSTASGEVLSARDETLQARDEAAASASAAATFDPALFAPADHSHSAFTLMNSDYTFAPAEVGHLLYKSTSAERTWTLPTSGVEPGSTYRLLNTGNGAITINRNGLVLRDVTSGGSSDKSLPKFGYAELICVNTGFWLITL